MTQNKKIRVYFAHPMDTYNTILEEYCIEELKRVFSKQSERMVSDKVAVHIEYEIVNPNTEEHQKGAKEGGMEYFKNIVLSCDEIVALPFPDETIGAGVGKELLWAEEAGMKCSVFGLHAYRINLTSKQTVSTFHMPILSVEETRAKLKRHG